MIASYLGDDHDGGRPVRCRRQPVARTDGRGHHHARNDTRRWGHEGTDTQSGGSAAVETVARGSGARSARSWSCSRSSGRSLIAVQSGDDDTDEASGDSESSTSAPPRPGPARGSRHLSGGQGRRNGDTIDWGDRCDTSTGLLALSRSAAAAMRRPVRRVTTVGKPTSGSRRTRSRWCCTSRRRTTRCCSSCTARSGSTTRPRTPGRPTSGSTGCWPRTPRRTVAGRARPVQRHRQHRGLGRRRPPTPRRSPVTSSRSSVVGGSGAHRGVRRHARRQQGDVHQLRPAPD